MNKTAAPIHVKSFDHVTIIVSNLQATRAFYVDQLGLTEIPRPDFDFPGLWFQIGNCSIHATIESDQAGRAGWGDHGGATLASRSHHFAFLVDDVDAIVDSIEAVGIKILSGPKRRPDGVKQVYVADPDGHVVELASL